MLPTTVLTARQRLNLRLLNHSFLHHICTQPSQLDPRRRRGDRKSFCGTPNIPASDVKISRLSKTPLMSLCVVVVTVVVLDPVTVVVGVVIVTV